MAHAGTAAAGKRDRAMLFQQRVYRSTTGSFFGQLELIYHLTVENIRSGHRTGGLGLFVNIAQVLALLFVFGALMLIMGMRASAIRGDFVLYLLSGIFLFMTHIKSIGSVFGADGPTSGMMQHMPMNTIVAIAGAALSTLYLQTLTVMIILFIYHAAINPISIDQPVGAIAAFLLAWLSGCAVGMMFRAFKPWAPRPIGMAKTVYQRLNMVASGKMFVANSVPGFMLPFFLWNPLFHTIDQARGFTFINYNPHYTSMIYPVYVSLVLITIGLMGEFFTRKHASASWNA